MKPGSGRTPVNEVHETADSSSGAPLINILLVDDDPRNLNVLESVLTSPDYRLVLARGADEALRALVAQEFALLVLDVRMPEMNGLELAHLIKQRRSTRHLPIIFLTAYYQEDEHVLMGYDAGAVDYLNKPCNPAVLRSKVGVFVELFRANRALEAEIAERRAAEARLAERTEEVQQLVRHLRALATELTQVEQRERKRIAGVLHDHIQQLLVSAKIQVASLTSNELPDRSRHVIEEVDSILKEAISASRSVTVELSPPILEEAGLSAALNWLARRMADKYRFTVQVEAEEGAEPNSEEHRFLLFECARELLFNSFKHAGVSTARVEVCRTDDTWVTMCVHDEGKGVDFEEVRKRGADQASFGLFSIQQRLMHIGATMEIDSTPGNGMHVFIRAPVGEPRPARVAVNELSTREQEGIMHARTSEAAIDVLIVDDHRIMRQGLVELMSGDPGIHVIGEAANAPQALDLVDRLNPDVIIMDVNLGETSGLQLTKSIMARKPQTKVIGLSMHEGADIANAMTKAGAVAYLSKSVASSELVATIYRVAQGPPSIPHRASSRLISPI